MCFFVESPAICQRDRLDEIGKTSNCLRPREDGNGNAPQTFRMLQVSGEAAPAHKQLTEPRDETCGAHVVRLARNDILSPDIILRHSPEKTQEETSQTTRRRTDPSTSVLPLIIIPDVCLSRFNAESGAHLVF